MQLVINTPGTFITQKRVKRGSSRRLTYGDLLAAISGNQYHIQAQWLKLCQQCCGVNETFRKIIDCESDMKRSRMPS
jgi:hypothetical protein